MPEYELGRLRGKFCIVWYEGGRRHRVTTGTADKVEANKVLAAFARQRAADARGHHTVGELWEMYRASLGARPSATTMSYEWKSLAPIFDSMQPSQINEAVCKRYIAARQAAGRKNGTIWTELGRLRMVFSWAVKRGHLDVAPYVDRPPAGPPRNLWVTATQAAEILHACEMPHLKLFVTIAWSTAARAQAILDLTWDRVDFDNERIDFEKPDGGRPMKGRSVVPINDTLRAALQEARRGALTDHVIEWGGRPVVSVKKGLKRAGERVGMPWISPHVFRHSAARMMAEDGVSMEEIAQFLGHTDDQMTQRVYARFSPGHLRKAAMSLELKTLRSVQLNLKKG